MQPDEILQLQLDELTKWLDLAVAHNLPAMVIIHGVGKGVLRNEIHALLKTRKEVKSFVQQYEPAYGDGATRVFFNTWPYPFIRKVVPLQGYTPEPSFRLGGKESPDSTEQPTGE